MMEEKIYRINENIQEALRFAEAKNAALITFNGAALYVLIEGREVLPSFAQEFFHILAIVLIIGITLSIIAFLPNMNPAKKQITKVTIDEWNERKKFSIFYFGHIRKFGNEEFLAKIYSHYGEKLTEPINKAELDLATQTIIISRITRHKYVFFSIAGHLTLIALIIPIPILALYWLAILLRRWFGADLAV